MTNGIGPSWFPSWLRQALTKFGSTFFREASWAKHDKGYARGHPSRAKCDGLFLAAMCRDAGKLFWSVIGTSASPKLILWASVRVVFSIALAWTFWGFCRLFGWMTYRKTSGGGE